MLLMFAQPTASAEPPPPAPARPTATVAYVPPPPGLARGEYDVPPWVIGLASLALVGAVVAFFVVRHRRAQKKRVYESVAPQSGPASSRR